MRLHTVITTEFALRDIKSGQDFYESQAVGLGGYFFDAIITDIESLQLYGGIHAIEYGYHKMPSRRFPFSVYYSLEDDTITVIAVLDQRSHPTSNHEELKQRST